MLDEADGQSDDLVYGPVVSHIRSENSIMSLLRRAEDKTADRITGFAGSMRFIYVHIGWFGVWVLGNLGLVGLGFRFDPPPFGILTLIVSLEAIFLATFVMISQNRQAARSEARLQLDFQNNIRSEIWSIHIGHALGINTVHVEATVAEAIRVSIEQLAATD